MDKLLNNNCDILSRKKALKVLVLFSVLALSFIFVKPVSATASPYSISMTSSGSQNINVAPSATGGTGSSISADAITVSTNCRSGYNFSIGASVSNTNLYLNGNSSNNTSGTYFQPSNGSTALSNAPNTWGFYYNASSTPTSSTAFSAVPALGGTNATIKTELSTPSSTDISDSFSIYYGVAVANGMPTGTYKMIPDASTNNGSIVYYLTMAESCMVPPSSVLYDKVESSVKTSNGVPMTQAISNLKAAITVPTSSNPATDTSNSGVYVYDSTLFGTASDASNDYPIYYYRGILDSDLDNTTSTYGSNGNGAYYPNYVVLSSTGTPSSTDTCWRIVRTTGSGGVKMIYNGYYGKTNTNSCANSTTNAQTTYNGSSLTVPFNTNSSTFAGKTYTGLQQRNIHAAGYTYSNLAASTTTATAISTIFGSTGNDTTTNVNSSIMKKYIEDWYDSNLSSYTSILEPDAGFCTDRSIYSNTDATAPMSDSDTLIPYGTSGMTRYYFGSYIRNGRTGDAKKPTLSCPRGTVDIYSASGASSGNKQLSKPIALLTADEVAFAGSGPGGSYSSNSSYSSFLRSGSNFWLLSPDYRASNGNAYGPYLNSNGILTDYSVSSAYGVRPAISLKHDVEVASGSGTATDPWVVKAPTPLYDLVASMSKGKNTDSNSHFSWTSITTPTSTDPSTDTSSSGVFEWDGKTAGNGIDSNGGSMPIYFYRGVLDTTPTSYGSDGLADAYPNYVKLANDTCWRIVRTTSTGGVKMIYNGTWTGSTCANATTAAQLTTGMFNTNSTTIAGTTYTGLQYQNIHSAGYTYSSLAAGTTANTTISTIFGASGNDTTTNTNSSVIKKYLEDWYGSNMISYTGLLEGDAGFCSDRSLNTGTGWTTALGDSSQIVPYGTSTTQYYFGIYPRNNNSATFAPTLLCPRGKVDLYSYSGNAGNGNGQLTYPVSLLTADEASLAGNGPNSSYNTYNSKSFLRSNSYFWLLSPNNRYTNGYTRGSVINSNGYLATSNLTGTQGIRPVISLMPGTTIGSGSGIATDPWTVE